VTPMADMNPGRGEPPRATLGVDLFIGGREVFSVDQAAAGTVEVVIETPLGAITVSLEAERAPITTSNFLSYVDRGFYDGGRFHRTVRLDNQSNANLRIEATDLGIADTGSAKPLPNDQVPIEVIQGGINLARKPEQGPPIPLERTSETGLRHLDGTISMGRTTTDSAVSDFFICVNDQPELDFGGRRNVDGQGFAAFGQVIEGMDIVHAIHQSPSQGQSLDPVIPITRIRRVRDGFAKTPET
jgi:peptidyl-prolyl cis-trans isomerase A (cyclophilin A)